jgi:glycosyltransferase involved in cell wall biosynthesis
MLLENMPYPQDPRVRAEARSLVRAGHHVTVVAPGHNGQARRQLVDGVHVVRFPLVDGSTHGAPGFIAEYLLAMVMLHLEAVRQLARGSTVLHLHNPPDVFFPAGALYRMAGRKVIFDHHDLFPETLEVKFGSGFATRIAVACQRLTFAVANHVIATNRSYGDVARGVGAKRDEEVTIVRNGPPGDWVRMPVAQRHGSLEQVRLVYLGAISAQDGVEGLAPIMARLCKTDGLVDARLTVVGDGDARPAVERAFAAHGLAHRVCFTGRVPAEHVPKLIADADICLDPAPATDVNERSTMTKIAEYLALGKPVVAYDLLETRRTAGDAAVLVGKDDVDAFAEAVAELARDGALRKRCSPPTERCGPARPRARILPTAKTCRSARSADGIGRANLRVVSARRHTAGRRT